MNRNLNLIMLPVLLMPTTDAFRHTGGPLHFGWVIKAQVQQSVPTVEIKPDSYDTKFKDQTQQLLKMSEDLRRAIDTATASMQEAARTDPSKTKIESLNKYFLEFRTKIQGLLDRFDDQSDFSMAIDGASASAIRALAWWKRQPASPEQQKMTKDLEHSVQQYEDAEQRRISIRDDASKQLRNLLSQQLQMQRIAQTDRIIDAAQELSSVLAGMQKLTKALSTLKSVGTDTPQPSS